MEHAISCFQKLYVKASHTIKSCVMLLVAIRCHCFNYAVSSPPPHLDWDWIGWDCRCLSKLKVPNLYYLTWVQNQFHYGLRTFWGMSKVKIAQEFWCSSKATLWKCASGTWSSFRGRGLCEVPINDPTKRQLDSLLEGVQTPHQDSFPVWGLPSS